MIFKLKGIQKTGAGVISMRCPACGQLGVFQPAVVEDLMSDGNRFGHRVCPGPDCHAHVFVILSNADLARPVVSYPAQRIDFDTSDIPPKIVAALEEAIGCHANRCFVAAAIMVRKTLEELCDDRGASGRDLKARLDDLRGRVPVPEELVTGLHELRLLGNDAAHLELKDFDGIDQSAVALAIDVVKEVLKRVYQSKILIERLRAFKKP